MRLRHGVELDAAVLGTRYLKDAQVFLAQDKAVGVVIHHDDAVILGKLHQTLLGLTLCTSTSRHIRIVGPHQLHT